MYLEHGRHIASAVLHVGCVCTSVQRPEEDVRSSALSLSTLFEAGSLIELSARQAAGKTQPLFRLRFQEFRCCRHAPLFLTFYVCFGI